MRLAYFVKVWAIAAACMCAYAWYETPVTPLLHESIVVEGSISASLVRRRERLQIDAGDRVHSIDCERAAAVCRLAAARPGTRVRAWIAESVFLDQDWLVRVELAADGRTLLAPAEQQQAITSHRQKLWWWALGAALAALAVVALVPPRPRPRFIGLATLPVAAVFALSHPGVAGSGVDEGFAGGVRKCVQGSQVTYTHEACPPGAKVLGVAGPPVNVLPAPPVRASAASGAPQSTLRDALDVSRDDKLRERMMERAIEGRR